MTTEKKKKRGELTTPIDALLDSVSDLAKHAWREKQAAIERAAMKPMFRIASPNIRPVMVVLDPPHVEAWQGSTDLLRTYLIAVLQEVGMYAEAVAILEAGRHAEKETPA